MPDLKEYWFSEDSSSDDDVAYPCFWSRTMLPSIARAAARGSPTILNMIVPDVMTEENVAAGVEQPEETSPTELTTSYETVATPAEPAPSNRNNTELEDTSRAESVIPFRTTANFEDTSAAEPAPSNSPAEPTPSNKSYDDSMSKESTSKEVSPAETTPLDVPGTESDIVSTQLHVSVAEPTRDINIMLLIMKSLRHYLK